MSQSRAHKRYCVGIDVGLNSVGLAAIEVDEEGTPVSILNMETIIHDGGIDPTANKSAGTRKAVSGAARRVRRLYRQRRRRLADLDRKLAELGWPIVDLEKISDPWYPWAVRAGLVKTRIDDPAALAEAMSVAIRHMARHRGWRNPYVSVKSLKSVTEPSKELVALTQSIGKRLGRDPGELAHLTVAEMVSLARRLNLREWAEPTVDRRTGEITGQTVYLDVSDTLRGAARLGKDGGRRAGLLEGKVHQSDNVRELRRIWDVQDLPEALFDSIVDVVFQAKSPKGSARERVAEDALDRSQRRAEKASLAFQRYRIVNILANLRILESGRERPLTPRERRSVLDMLWESAESTAGETTWADVAAHLGVDRRALRGTAKETEDGDRASARPPVNVTATRVLACGVKELVREWTTADEGYQEALIEVLGNGSGSGADQALVMRAEEFMSGLPEDMLAKVEGVRLPEGRAAYSVRTLARLTERMLTTEDDLSAARKAVFDTPDDWRPEPDPIGQPVGNPAVDRVLTIVNRYLLACEREWGAPLSVNIEHTREGLMSDAQAKKIDRENDARFARNREIEGEIAAYLNAQGEAVAAGLDDSFEENPESVVTGRAIGRSRGDIDRWRALVRQNQTCLYCGEPLSFPVFEMDHIVPRAERGATNSQVNLAAVCRECNHSKGRQPFAVWAKSGIRPQVNLGDALKRADGFRFFGPESTPAYSARFKREVKSRLLRTDLDDPLDGRSIESVGWMASELRHRIEAHFARSPQGTPHRTTVGVYRGWITAEARKAAGIEDRIILIGGSKGKSRLDRRHHAVDAATIALLRQGAAQSMTVQSRVRLDAEWAASERIAREEGMVGWDISNVLAIRDNLRRTNQIDPRTETDWRNYKGSNPALFDAWREHMRRLADLVSCRAADDGIPVFELLRLRPGSSAGHEDTVRPLASVRVGDEMPSELIDRSATPQQWIALVRQPGYEPGKGLPMDPGRRLRVLNRWYEPREELPFFPTGAGCVAVRGGYAELGSSFHHARVYRCTKRLRSGASQVFFAMMRVYNLDLLPYRGSARDVFTVDLPPQCISRRTAEGRLREALDCGDAEYVGWIVPGDELLLDIRSQTTGAIGLFLDQFPGTVHWVVQGLFAQSRLHLRPRYLASEGAVVAVEGVPRAESLVDVPQSTMKILGGQGYLPSVDVVFGGCHATVIRRDILGRVRTRSSANLPITWGAIEAD